MARRMHFIWLLCVAVAAQNVTDPCTSHSTIDGKSRQVQVETASGATPICDEDLTPGWYRFSAGTGEVAVSKVASSHCGTQSTIWMDDKLPPPGSIVNRKFCFNHQDISPTGCLWDVKSPVKNCGDFIVYKLPLDRTLCPMALCTDPSVQPCPPGQVSTTGFVPCKRIPCRPGKWSPSGFEPCGDPYPVLTNVTLSGPDEVMPLQFKHLCLITSNDTKADAKFNVTWSMNGVPVHSEILSGPDREAFFDVDRWEGHLNQKLTCSVKAYYEHTKNHTTKEFTSNSYFGGIKIEPTPLILPEGTDKTIEIISTLPINCEEPSQMEFCKIDLHAISPRLYTVGSCKVSLTPYFWNSTTHEARQPMEVASVVDPAVKPDQHTHLAVDLTYNKTVLGLEMWGNASQIKIEVIVKESKSGSCVATGDPHFSQSFSYHRRYNLYHQGDFNYASDSRVPIAVQIETNTLYQPTHLPMVSGIAVQTGSDVTVIDTYGGSKMASVTANRIPTTHTVQACGTNEYQISTSTGHRINVHPRGSTRSGFSLDVSANFPAGMKSLSNIPSYINHTYHDLCNLGPNTDGHNTFGRGGMISSKIIDLFRVLPTQNLFKGEVLPLTPVTGSNSPKSSKQYCSCNQDPFGTLQAKCSSTMKVDDPMVKRSSCKVIQPRIIITPPSQKRPGEHNFQNFNPVLRNWPTPSGINETYARDKCRHDITTFVPKECAGNKNLNIDDIVANCADDVLASDGFDYIGGAIQAFQSQCESEILSNPTNYNNNGGMPAVLTDQCPNFCNMHGACVKGVCQCDAGWEWTDCSVESGKPFQITGIQGSVLCDKSVSGNCFKPVLNVENIGDIRTCEVVSSGYAEGRPRKVEANFTGTQERESTHSVSCDFATQIAANDFHAKSFRIHLIPVSIKQSPQYIDYLVYDGVCQKCQEDLTCYLKENACLIGGKCYKAGEVLDTRFSCNPDLNIDEWSITKQSVGMPAGQLSSGRCVKNCTDKDNGFYQSCMGCQYYVSCMSGVTSDGKSCPPGTVWNDNIKFCDKSSTTCSGSPLVQ